MHLFADGAGQFFAGKRTFAGGAGQLFAGKRTFAGGAGQLFAGKRSSYLKGPDELSTPLTEKYTSTSSVALNDLHIRSSVAFADSAPTSSHTPSDAYARVRLHTAPIYRRCMTMRRICRCCCGWGILTQPATSTRRVRRQRFHFCQ